MPTFGERLRELRQQAGMTQEALASASGMSIGSIRNYEQDVREPYWVGVFKLAEALGVSCDAFKNCVGPGPKKKGAAGKAPGVAQGERSPGKVGKDATAAKKTPRGRRKGKGD